MAYLPKGYGGGDDYPVWYGLHGYGSDETMWINGVGIDRLAGELTDAGSIKPMIMVFPLTRYDTIKEIQEDMAQDGKRGDSKMGRFVCNELVPYVDANFSTIASADGRYIGGFSMGGAIALEIAFRHTDMFSKVGGYSAAVASSDYSERQLEKWLFPNDDVEGIEDIVGFDRDKGLDRLQVYIDCGSTNEPFLQGLQSLSECLRKRGIRHEFHVFPGGHDVQHVINNIETCLKFYSS